MRSVVAAIAAIASVAGCAPNVSPPAPLASGQTPPSLAALPVTPPTEIVRFAEHERGIGELRVPPGRGPFPVAMLIHGGCWIKGVGSLQGTSALASRLAAQGIATFNVDYREVGDGGGWPGTFSDWERAGDALARLARQHPLDLERVALIGHSAGATGALWLASPQDRDGPLGARPPMRVDAIVVLDGPADLAPLVGIDERVCGRPAIAPFMGGTPAEMGGRYRAISALAHAPLADRVLFVEAALPPIPEGVLAALRNAGAEVEVMRAAEPEHFDVIAPGTPSYAAIEPALLQVLRGR